MVLTDTNCEHTFDSVTRFADKTHHVLDVGSGSGRFSKMMQDAGYELHALDIGDYRDVPIKNFQVYDGLNFPHKDNSFDMVIFNFVLHHVPNTEKRHLLKEAIRVSRKHILVLEDTPKYFFDHAISFGHGFFWRYKIKSKQGFGFYNRRQWHELFNHLGLKIEFSKPLNRFCRKKLEPMARSLFLLNTD